MHRVRVDVLRHGEPAIGHRVAIDFGDLGGMSQAEHTDCEGRATFEVGDTQDGSICVERQRVGRWGAGTHHQIMVDL